MRKTHAASGQKSLTQSAAILQLQGQALNQDCHASFSWTSPASGMHLPKETCLLRCLQAELSPLQLNGWLADTAEAQLHCLLDLFACCLPHDPSARSTCQISESSPHTSTQQLDMSYVRVLYNTSLSNSLGWHYSIASCTEGSQQPMLRR